MTETKNPAEFAERFEVTPQRLERIFNQFLNTVSHQLLATFPAVRRWEQTDDVVQQAAVRLVKALEKVRPKSELHLEHLAALQIRRTLLTLAEKLEHSIRSCHATPSLRGSSFSSLDEEPADEETSDELARWAELHRSVDHLPERPREVFQLIWYRGLSRHDVANLMSVDIRTVQRSFRVARELLRQRVAVGAE